MKLDKIDIVLLIIAILLIALEVVLSIDLIKLKNVEQKNYTNPQNAEIIQHNEDNGIIYLYNVIDPDTGICYFITESGDITVRYSEENFFKKENK